MKNLLSLLLNKSCAMREQRGNTTELKQTAKMINSLLISKLSASKVKQKS